ncbi:MAG: ZIP family metal transporter [Ignavibacteriales bacterium]|nr:ZIP family metal transporter [Ignavibacteriales bacterium]
MNEVTIFIIIAGIVAAGAEILGGAFVAWRRDVSKKIQEYLIALGAGFLLALVMIDLLPESIAHLGATAPLWMLFGFSVIHFVEHTVVKHLHFGEETHSDIMISKIASYSAFWGLFIHAFFDGLAISAGMYFDFSLGIMIFLAITLHKFPEGLTIASIMLASQQTKKTALRASAGVAGGTMIGILMIFFLQNVDPKITGYAFAFSAGAALYVSASDLIPEINRSDNRRLSLVVFGGMVLFYLSGLLVHEVIGH